MTIPDDVRKSATATAVKWWWADETGAEEFDDLVDAIARAIMAERERIACIADDMEEDFAKDAREAETSEARSNASYASDVMTVFAAAIRLSPTPPKGGEHEGN